MQSFFCVNRHSTMARRRAARRVDALRQILFGPPASADFTTRRPWQPVLKCRDPHHIVENIEKFVHGGISFDAY
jgi:hypothetical protein